MAVGRRGFVRGLTGILSTPACGPRLPPRAGRLAGRGYQLSELAAGSSLTRVVAIRRAGQSVIGRSAGRASIRIQTGLARGQPECGQTQKSFRIA